MKHFEALKKYFNYDEFRPAQEEIIEAILAGNNVLAILPTGAGKSLCYQIPALISDNFSIVISPLIALMKDQVDALNKSGIIAGFINSSMSFNEAEVVLRDIAYGKIKLLYIAPERLENLNFAERIKQLNPAYLFIDESHCISEWGHSFRPSYTKISDFAAFTEVKQISAFTATATPEVVKDIVNNLKLKDPKIFVKGFERKNLRLSVLFTKKKKEKTLELLVRHKTPAIIYTASRKKAEEAADYLTANGVHCVSYHAGLESIVRKKIQEDFLTGKIKIIAATNAFGMGIDKKDIRTIIHFNMPGNIESYYQEIGRAGRDGIESDAFLLYDDSDIFIHNYFISNSHPDKELVQKIYDAICDFNQIAEGSTPDRDLPYSLPFITAYVNKQIPKGLLHSSLKILEQAGYLKIIDELNNKNRVKIVYSKETLKKYVTTTSNKNMSVLLIQMVKDYGHKIFQFLTEVSLFSLAKSTGINESEINDILILLDNMGVVEYIHLHTKENVRLLTARVNSKRLKLDFKRINDSYLNKQKKIQQMVDFAYIKDCRFKYILKYFGEEDDTYRCGKCDNCTEKVQPQISSDYIKEIFLKTLFDLKEHLAEKKFLAILLGNGGLEKYFSLNTYGACSNYTNEELLLSLYELINQNYILRKKAGSKYIEISEKGTDYLRTKGFIVESIKENPDYEENLILFNLLKDIRDKAARKYLQKSYLICPDETIREITVNKPRTRDELLNIKGFNFRMFNKIGEDILELINADAGIIDDKTLKEESIIPQNIFETYELVKKGYSLPDIAALRKLSEPVVSMQIETIISFDKELPIENLIKQETLEKINTELRKGVFGIKELKSVLPENISYGEIRIAAAKYKSRQVIL